jgi:hypothetical protein
MFGTGPKFGQAGVENHDPSIKLTSILLCGTICAPIHPSESVSVIKQTESREINFSLKRVFVMKCE